MRADNNKACLVNDVFHSLRRVENEGNTKKDAGIIPSHEFIPKITSMRSLSYFILHRTLRATDRGTRKGNISFLVIEKCCYILHVELPKCFCSIQTSTSPLLVAHLSVPVSQHILFHDSNKGFFHVTALPPDNVYIDSF